MTSFFRSFIIGAVLPAKKPPPPRMMFSCPFCHKKKSKACHKHASFREIYRTLSGHGTDSMERLSCTFTSMWPIRNGLLISLVSLKLNTLGGALVQVDATWVKLFRVGFRTLWLLVVKTNGTVDDIKMFHPNKKISKITAKKAEIWRIIMKVFSVKIRRDSMLVAIF